MNSGAGRRTGPAPDAEATLLRHHNDSHPLLQDELSRMVTEIHVNSSTSHDTGTRKATTTTSGTHGRARHRHRRSASPGASPTHQAPPSTVANVSAVSSASYTAEAPVAHYGGHRRTVPPCTRAAQPDGQDPYRLYEPTTVRLHRKQPAVDENTPPAAWYGSGSLSSVYSHELEGNSPSTGSQTAPQSTR
ncbi:hypothetical protein STCU_12207 [Strigomonas culicis]|uniref:Uncharacterized protein n=1 Tax=Strigomonas culicis TaxID=28005 RepID=S9TFX5_9TRYP|nr:hypothetical protein STCU_12207 [Strigomonas culicis]|eukprot:EPY15243.1 hypothetical protein STCU_12207 [Strigomonas culicis]